MSRRTASNILAAIVKAGPRFTAHTVASLSGEAEGNVREWLAALADGGGLRRVTSTMVLGPDRGGRPGRGGGYANVYELALPPRAE